VLPPWSRGAAAAGFLVLGSVTMLAIPVLGGFGAPPGNPTLLDRDYRTGWLVFAALVVAASAGLAAIDRQRAMRVRAAGLDAAGSDLRDDGAAPSRHGGGRP
jgi:hypothetical protein